MHIVTHLYQPHDCLYNLYEPKEVDHNLQSAKKEKEKGKILFAMA